MAQVIQSKGFVTDVDSVTGNNMTIVATAINQNGERSSRL